MFSTKLIIPARTNYRPTVKRVLVTGGPGPISGIKCHKVDNPGVLELLANSETGITTRVRTRSKQA